VCFTTIVVSTVDSRAGLAHWGFPGECGTLRWTEKDDGAEVVWEERGVVLTGQFGRRRRPLRMPVRAIQARADRPMLVPVRMHALARRARVAIEVPADDALAALVGRHWGLHLGGLETVLRTAVEPLGLWARVRATEGGVEPGIP
jgi:hypothetical protein